jgi:hypothetical protein
MSNTIRNMALELCKASQMVPTDYAGKMDGKDVTVLERMEAGVRASLLYLADNVTDEMVKAADYELASDDALMTKGVVAAALLEVMA